MSNKIIIQTIIEKTQKAHKLYSLWATQLQEFPTIIRQFNVMFHSLPKECCKDTIYCSSHQTIVIMLLGFYFCA